MPEFGRLRMDLGLYLGTVIVTNVACAQWHAWPNGHPVVQLGDGTTFDVVALADQTVDDDKSTLFAIYEKAVSR